MPSERLREYAKRLTKAEQDKLRSKIIEERKRLRRIKDEANNRARERAISSIRRTSA